MEAWGTVQSQGKGDMLAACWAARLLFTWCEVRTHRTEMKTNREGHRDQWGPNKETRETVLELRRVSGESSDLVLEGPASPLLSGPLQPLSPCPLERSSPFVMKTESLRRSTHSSFSGHGVAMLDFGLNEPTTPCSTSGSAQCFKSIRKALNTRPDSAGKQREVRGAVIFTSALVMKKRRTGASDHD